MKILFLCGSYESGKDGVGDYIRILANQLVNMNHIIAITALYDKYVSEVYLSTQFIKKETFLLQRIPFNFHSNQRFKLLKKLIDTFEPDLISLQFVPFAFQAKGLPINLGIRLIKISQGRNWHIMFHEIWVGLGREAGLKFRVWGWLQKNIIKNLIYTLKPTIVHTQSTLHQALLMKIGINSKLLPLFSHIPKYVNMSNVKYDEGNSSIENCISFIAFGAIHNGGLINEFITELISYAKKRDVEISLVMVGRNGNAALAWSNIWVEAGFKVSILGEQNPEQISFLFENSSIGISTSSYEMIEKSSTVSSMIEQGLPVICIGKKMEPRGLNEFKPSTSVIEYQPGNIEKIIRLKKSSPIINKTFEISTQFLLDLS